MGAHIPRGEGKLGQSERMRKGRLHTKRVASPRAPPAAVSASPAVAQAWPPRPWPAEAHDNDKLHTVAAPGLAPAWPSLSPPLCGPASPLTSSFMPRPAWGDTHWERRVHVSTCQHVPCVACQHAAPEDAVWRRHLACRLPAASAGLLTAAPARPQILRQDSNCLGNYTVTHIKQSRIGSARTATCGAYPPS